MAGEAPPSAVSSGGPKPHRQASRKPRTLPPGVRSAFSPPRSPPPGGRRSNGGTGQRQGEISPAPSGDRAKAIPVATPAPREGTQAAGAEGPIKPVPQPSPTLSGPVLVITQI